MTQGNPTRLIISFAIPMLIGNIFQQIYNVADTIIVGRFLGASALAGVGSTGTLTCFLTALVIGLCNGAGLVAAQCFGCRNTGKLKQVIVALIWTAGSLTIVVSLLGIFCSRFFLKLLSVPEDVMDYSVTYLRIIYSFVIGSVIYNGTASLLRSTGDSKTPLYAVIASSLVNICLDLFFILACDLGVAGAAYATILSQCMSASVCIISLYRKRKELGITNLNWHADRNNVLLIIKTGFPSAFQSCMISLGGMSVQRLVNSYGSSVMAANRIDSVAIQVIVSIGTALSVFTGQNMGQNNFARIHEGLRKTLTMMMVASISIAICVLLFRYPLMKLFLDESSAGDAIQIGATYLSIIGVAYVIAGIMQSYQNVIRGSGDVNTCMVAGLTELAGRIVFAYLLSSLIGSTGIWIATPLSWSCGCVIPVIRYYSGKWKSKKLV